MKHLPLIVLFCAGIGSQLLAQTPDAVWEHLFSPEVVKDTFIAETDGLIQLYTNGTELSFFIQVNDSLIQAEDHLIIWLGLPQTAFPSDFPYASHPTYFAPPRQHLRGERGLFTRLFSAVDGLDQFFDTYRNEQPDSADLTPWQPSNLMTMEVPFGLVGYQIFADGRPAQLVNAAEIEELSDLWKVERLPWERLVRYTAEEQEWGKGMVFNVSIPTEALGFVCVPDHREVNTAVDWVKATHATGQWELVGTTAPRETFPGIQGRNLTQVSLSTPLFTDLPGIPAPIWYEGGYFPICFRSESGWVGVEGAMDALFFRPGWPSTDLVELSFAPVNLAVEQEIWKDRELTRLHVQLPSVWRFPWEDWWFQLGDQHLTLHRIPETPLLFGDSWFELPDGTPASLLSQHQRAFPYPWHASGNEWADEAILYRWKADGPERMVEIRQNRWPVINCEVGPLQFENYQITSYDLLPGGRRMVIWLENWEEEKLRKRIKISWDDAGKGVVVEEIP
ncbi:MAG: hypothetical protein AAF399_05165 [Bacteroidota bacterium]